MTAVVDVVRKTLEFIGNIQVAAVIHRSAIIADRSIPWILTDHTVYLTALLTKTPKYSVETVA